jgi:hypothetical protein
MEVLVIQIEWHLEMPIATVYSPVSGTILRVALLHRSYVIHNRIGIGTELMLSTNGFIVQVLRSAGDVILPPTQPVFAKWVAFKRQLAPSISHRVARLLFVNGVETVQDLKRRGMSIGQIPGIGPVTMNRIIAMHASLD